MYKVYEMYDGPELGSWILQRGSEAKTFASQEEALNSLRARGEKIVMVLPAAIRNMDDRQDCFSVARVVNFTIITEPISRKRIHLRRESMDALYYPGRHKKEKK